MEIKKLTNKNGNGKSYSRLTNNDNLKFRMAISGSLNGKYSIKNLKEGDIKHFHKFIEETVGKELTITQVDKLFLRTKGKISEKEDVHGRKREIIHYGKDRNPFRIFGYYDDNGYFVIYKIDPKHRIHKE